MPTEKAPKLARPSGSTINGVPLGCTQLCPTQTFIPSLQAPKDVAEGVDGGGGGGGGGGAV